MNEFWFFIHQGKLQTWNNLPSTKQKQIPESVFHRDIHELPSVSDFKEDGKGQETLTMFDGFIHWNTKEFHKIQEYLAAGRDFGFTCCCLAQNYVSIPKTTTSDGQYLIFFKLNDNNTTSIT